jgi:hypothetical protein
MRGPFRTYLYILGEFANAIEYCRGKRYRMSGFFPASLLSCVHETGEAHKSMRFKSEIARDDSIDAAQIQISCPSRYHATDLSHALFCGRLIPKRISYVAELM